MPTCVFKEIHPAFVVWPESETPRGKKSHTDNDLEIDANKLEWKMKSIKKANLRIPVAHVPNTRSSNVFHGNRNAVSRFQLGEMGFCFFLYIFTYSLINPLKKTKWSTIKLSFSDGSLTTKLKSSKKNEKKWKNILLAARFFQDYQHRSASTLFAKETSSSSQASIPER